jgi:hypothetical protein
MSNAALGRLSRFAPRAREVDAVHGIASKASRTQLRSIIECPEFDASDRNRRFLRCVVDEALDGRAERIKSVQHRNIGVQARRALPMLTLPKH